MEKNDFSAPQYNNIQEFFKRSSQDQKDKTRISIPENLGKGYLMTVSLGESMSMTLYNYLLLTSLNGNKKSEPVINENVTFSFRNVFKADICDFDYAIDVDYLKRQIPSVQVSTSDMDVYFSFPANSVINSIVITITKDVLLNLIHTPDEKKSLEGLIYHNKPFIYEEFSSPRIHHIASKILLVDVRKELSTFELRIKCEELIYEFLIDFLKRKSNHRYTLNALDLRSIYIVRDKIAKDLLQPPSLALLATFSGMSESKLNRNFKQVFGSPIYNYHQKLRILQAAELLKTRQMTVSEVGYKLGFSNLSHFSRLFNRYIGRTPKKFSKH